MAVFTALDDNEIRTFLSDYDLPSVVARTPLNGGVSNSNWRIDLDGEPRAVVLTVIEPPIAASDLDFVLAYQYHLATHHLRIAPPISRLDGRLYGRLAGKPALVSLFLDGEWPREPNAGQAAAIGQLLARMHMAAGDFSGRRANPMAIPDMAEIARALDPLEIEQAVPGLAVELAEEFADVLDRWPGGLPAGAVHCDLFPDNTLFEGNRLSGAIDFYFACTAPFAYDFAMTHAAWCFSEGESRFRAHRSQALLEAYEAERPLSGEERAALPLFARAACLRILVTRLRGWVVPQADATVTAKHPGEFARRLRFYSSEEGANAFAR